MNGNKRSENERSNGERVRSVLVVAQQQKQSLILSTESVRIKRKCDATRESAPVQ